MNYLPIGTHVEGSVGLNGHAAEFYSFNAGEKPALKGLTVQYMVPFLKGDNVIEQASGRSKIAPSARDF